MIPKQLSEHLDRLTREKFYGNILINFADGKVQNWNVNQSFKATILVTNHPETRIEASGTSQ